MTAFSFKTFLTNMSKRVDGLASKAADRGAIPVASRYWQVLDWIGGESSLTEVARRLVGGGRLDDALALLLTAIRSKGAFGEEALKDYQFFCTWLGEAGYVKEAEERIGRLPDQSLKGAGKWFVGFWHRRSILDPDNIGKLRQFLEQAPDRETENRILWLLYMTEGPGEELYKLYEGAAARGNRSAGRDLLSILAEFDHERFFKMAGKKPRWIPKRETSLAVDLLLSDAQGRLADLIGEDQRLLARHFRAGTESIWARIADPNMSVAVVGNSPCETGTGKGPEIDAHDIVIRFNRVDVDPKYHADYGSKTDILVMNCMMLPGFLDTLDLPFIVTGKDWEIFTREKQRAIAFARKGVAFTSIPRHVRTTINRAVKATASSGVQTLAAVCDARGGNEKVGVYGFSLVDQIGENPTSANYFRNSKPHANHNWRGEALLLDALRQDGTIDSAASIAGAERYNNQWKTLEGFTPTRYRIEGDHSNYHCGSAAVTRSLRHFLGASGVVVDGEDYDVLIVNGEGTMHHGSPGFHRKMKLLRRALDAGKSAYLVNTVWQDNPHHYDDVLRGLNGVIAREVLSQKELTEKHGIGARLHPDMAFYAPLKKATNPVDYKGSIVLTDFFSKEFDAFVKLTRAEALKYPFVDMLTIGWDDLIESLQTAEMIITGRHHAVFAACRAGIPFVAFGGNTHKIEGIFRSAGVNIPLCENRAKLPEMIEWVRNNRQEYEKLFDYLKSFKGWKP